MSPDLAAIVTAELGPDAPRRVGVAVSGGGDSMALLVALAEAGFAPEAVTVDHGLRPDAAAEAAQVARFCAARGITHDTLHWNGARAEGNLMDAARRARLALIGTWARGRGLTQVALGHTADDQAETFLMRLSRAAGLEGLAGMRSRFEAEGIVWLRPVLSVGRADLRDWLVRREIGWIDDPSNDNARFDRVRARRALTVLHPLGITVARLGEVVRHLAAADDTFGLALARFAGAHVQEVAGDLVIDARAFADEIDPEMRRRLMNAALIWVSGADYGPRAPKLADFLITWRERRDRTLHGCRISTSDTAIRITREAKAVVGLRVPVGAGWDRWQLDGPATPGLEIAALGADGLKQVKHWRESDLPRVSLLASPAIWHGETVVAAPLAGLENGWKARIACGAFARALIRR